MTYAISEWPYHTSKVGEEAKQYRRQILQFFDPQNELPFLTWVRDRALLDSRFRIAFRISTTSDNSILPTPLHVTAYCGLDTVTSWLLDTNHWKLTDVDNTGGTALHAAAEQGCDNVIRVLLQVSYTDNFRDLQDGSG